MLNRYFWQFELKRFISAFKIPKLVLNTIYTFRYRLTVCLKTGYLAKVSRWSRKACPAFSQTALTDLQTFEKALPRRVFKKPLCRYIQHIH